MRHDGRRRFAEVDLDRTQLVAVGVVVLRVERQKQSNQCAVDVDEAVVVAAGGAFDAASRGE